MVTTLSVIVAALVVVVTVLSETVKVTDLQTFKEPEANGSTDFPYTNDKTKQAAETIEQFYKDAEGRLSEYKEELKTSNKASKYIKKYEDAIKSAAGTKCAVSKQEQNEFNGAQENIEAIIDICGGSIPKEDFDTLTKTIASDLAKVQAIDNTLRLNAEICFSLRVPPSDHCKKAKENALDRLNGILTDDELSRLRSYSEQAVLSAKNYIDTCVDERTKSLQENLSDSINAISDCKNTTS